MFRLNTPACVRSPFAVASLVIVLAALGGCGTNETSDPPQFDVGTDTAADAGVDASADTGPNLTPCDDNTDCAGGEVCREGFCRQSCESSDDCTGDLPACDDDLGYCVGCVTDDDCGDDAICNQSTCIFYCGSDEACADDEFCDEATGGCLTRECESAADCSGGFTCDDYRCVPIDDIICTPDDARCSDDGTAVLTCNGDGTVETESACGAEQVCIDGDDGPACFDVLCAPNDVGCLDDVTAYLCDATGTEQNELPCGDGRYCDAGTCRDRVCEPDTISCDGNAVVSCDALGASVAVEACAETAACASSDFGCTCVDGSCETRTCTPGTARCVGDSVQACAEDGLGYDAPAACDASEICVAGACVTRECTAGTRECAGDTLVECNEDGTSRTETSCAADGEICTGSGATAACTARVCVPDAIACDATGSAVVTCDARGSAESTTPCPAGTYCTGGACLDQVCAPGSGDVCVDGDVQRCNARGSGYLLVDDCDAETQRCRAGACLDLACEAGVTRCSGDTLLECSLDGLTETATACRDIDSYCDSDTLACEPWVCVPGVSTCDGDDVVTCDARGTAAGVTETCSETLGCDGGACVEGCGDGIEQPGEECDDGNLVDGDGCDGSCVSECDVALDFNGESTAVTVPVYAARDLGAQRTHALWLRLNSVPGARSTIFDDGVSGAYCGSTLLRVLGDDGRLEYGSFAGTSGTRCSPGENFAYSPSPLPLGRWVHVAVTIDGGTVSWFFDGAPSGATTFSSVDPYTPFRDLQFGFEDGRPVNEHLDGSMRDVLFYNRTLTAEEIELLASTGPSAISDTSLVGWWPLDDGSGSVARNLAAGGRDGLIIDGSWFAICESSGAQRSCADYLLDDPDAASGHYTIDPDGAGPVEPFTAYCDMTTMGGGWTMVFVPTNANYGVTDLRYTYENDSLMASATEALIAHRSLSTMAVVGDGYRFPMLTGWRENSPFSSRGETIVVDWFATDGSSGRNSLKYGYANFPRRCSDDFQLDLSSVWGRICIEGTDAPFFSGFARSDQGDWCSRSDQEFGTTTCTADFGFTIGVR